jgi:hypothetical protein
MRKIIVDEVKLRQLIEERYTIDQIKEMLNCPRQPLIRTAKELGLSFRGWKKGEKSDDFRFMVIAHYKSGAKVRGLDFLLTEDQFFEIVIQPCVYCGDCCSNAAIYKAYNKRTSKRKKPFYYTGIDRKDSSKGYFIGNCEPCCTRCNRAKSNASSVDFLDWIDRIIKFNQK